MFKLKIIVLGGDAKRSNALIVSLWDDEVISQEGYQREGSAPVLFPNSRLLTLIPSVHRRNWGSAAVADSVRLFPLWLRTLNIVPVRCLLS
jgi:hypothetical protein